MRRIAFAAAIWAVGCMQPDPAGPDSGRDPDPVMLRDDGRLAGATSSTNWPQEDAGSQPVKIHGRADSILSFSFEQAPEAGREPEPIGLAAQVRVYQSGFIPIFDSVPSLTFDFPASDTIKVEPERLNSLFNNELDTIRFGIEWVTDSTHAFLPGFTYSKKQMKFLGWPSPINTQGSFVLTDPHYKVAGIPDSSFQTLLSEADENAGFYYYIAGLPYFWLHSLSRDSLYIGPFPSGSFPLRCVKVTSETGPIAKFTVEVFPLSLVKESFNDSIKVSRIKETFSLGDPLLRFSGIGSPGVRDP